MRYAVMQENLEPPAREKLVRAFRAVKGLTATDADILGNDAFGILVKNFSFENATALQIALAAEGVKSEVAPDSSLPPLPQARFVTRVDCRSEGLMVYDPLGRGFPVEWRHIMLIAAGKVRQTELDRARRTRPVPRYAPDGNAQYNETVMDYSSREERHDRLLLEIVMSRAVLRYSITADKSAHLLFQYLGDRRTGTLTEDFTRLIQDLTKFAPHSAINRGAYHFRENAADAFCYPSKNSFYEEIIWLLWRLAGATAPPP